MSEYEYEDEPVEAKFDNADLGQFEKLKDQALAALKALGGKARESSAELVAYAAKEAEAVAMCAGTPDIDAAVEYARTNVALAAGIEALEVATQADRDTRNILFTLVNMLASALAGKPL